MILGQVITLDPTKKQIIAFYKAAGCARFAYNWGLNEWEQQYKSGSKPTAFAIKKKFNKIKKEIFPWIYDSPKDANQQAFSDLGTAFSNFFRGLKGKGSKVGYPVKRLKGHNDSFYVSNDLFHFHKDSKRVYLPVIGSIKIHESLRLSGKILSGRVNRIADTWYLSVQVECEARVPTAHTRSIIGVDLGIKTAIFPSQGKSENAPKPLKQALTQLKKLQHRVSRKKKGSRNRLKAIKRVAKLYAKIANKRHDFMHKITTQLVRENQTIVIEDLNVKGMLRDHKLARAIADIGFGLFKRLLEYKSVIYGSTIVVASRWFPSSKRCSSCGNIKETLSLNERVYTCDKCGLTIDRDYNASLNLEQYPRLLGNWNRKVQTPIETRTSARITSVNRVSSVAEVGTKPCSFVSTS